MSKLLKEFKKKLGTNQIGSIEEMRLIAKKHNGSVTSKNYKNAHTKLSWICSTGHKFEMTAHAVKSGKWCPMCANLRRNDSKKLSIADCHKLAKERGGKCESSEYLNSHSKLKWNCEICNNSWWASFGQIKDSKNRKGTWCPKCSGVGKIDLKDLNELASSRGGKCLSKKYITAISKVKWECSIGHQWVSSWNSANNGSWCPECQEGLGERICRAYFEQLLNSKFPKYRPDWLVNDDGNKMELDGYSEKLKIAFEHQGRQHKRLDGFFHRTTIHFEKRKKDDLTKLKLCKKYGVKLIEVDEIFVEVKLQELREYLIKKFKKAKIEIPSRTLNKKIDLSKSFSIDKLEEIKELAKQKNGKLISNHYAGTFEKLDFKCSEKNHPVFKISPTKIKSGQWCKICGKEEWLKRVHQNHFEKIREIVKDKKGKIISKSYPGRGKQIEVKCNVKKHPIFKTTPASIDTGKWCKLCAYERVAKNNRNEIEEIQKIANSKNGICLSKVYANNRSRLKWKCSQGHTWEAPFKDILRGRWCAKCSREKSKLGKTI